MNDIQECLASHFRRASYHIKKEQYALARAFATEAIAIIERERLHYREGRASQVESPDDVPIPLAPPEGPDF